MGEPVQCKTCKKPDCHHPQFECFQCGKAFKKRASAVTGFTTFCCNRCRLDATAFTKTGYAMVRNAKAEGLQDTYNHTGVRQ